MICLYLTHEEQRTLREVMDSALRELDKEILHTDHAEFRTRLKARRDALAKIVDRLTEAVAS